MKMDELELGKPFGIMSYEKAQLENFNFVIVADFDTEDEVVAAFEDYENQRNAVQGFEIVYKEPSGIVYNYAGDPIEIPL